MKVFSATDIGQKRQMNQDYIYTSVEPVGNLPNLLWWPTAWADITPGTSRPAAVFLCWWILLKRIKF